MGTTEASRIQHFARLLAARQGELNTLLCRPARDAANDTERHRDMRDFKDLAAGASQAVIDEAASEQALRELVEIAGALRRLRDGSYGSCVDCGDPIAEQRLLALPATAYCVACQAFHERAMPASTKRIVASCGSLPTRSASV